MGLGLGLGLGPGLVPEEKCTSSRARSFKSARRLCCDGHAVPTPPARLYSL